MTKLVSNLTKKQVKTGSRFQKSKAPINYIT